MHKISTALLVISVSGISQLSLAQQAQSVWFPSNITSIAQISPVHVITQQQYLADLTSLEQNMQQGYGGRRDNGLALQAAFQRLEAVTGFPLSSQQICNLIGNELQSVPDGHLSVYTWGGGLCGPSFPGGSLPSGHVGSNLATSSPWQYFACAQTI